MNNKSFLDKTEIGDCLICGKRLVRSEECVIGFPDYHVEGSRVEYCGACGPFPHLTLKTSYECKFLVPNAKEI